MNAEESIKKCEYNLNQINHFNPDPYYVNYFFEEYLKSVSDVYDEIFEEANRDFGLFITGKSTKEKFESKAREKNDQVALKFLSWFKENFENEHNRSYPIFMKNIICFYKKYNQLPKISIKILANQRYKEDVCQSLQVGLTKGKIRSIEELKIEIKRQCPGFLEVINQKRKNHNEPKVSESQIIASAFLEIENHEIEIPYACEIYLPVMNRFLEKSRNEIKRLTSWVD